MKASFRRDLSLNNVRETIQHVMSKTKISTEQSLRGANALFTIRNFMPTHQKETVRQLIRGEEGQFFVDKVVELAAIVDGMPKVYGQDGKGDGAIVYLHYFGPNFDVWISEKDTTAQQIQAFGKVKFSDGDAELGYINLEDLFATCTIELDFHFTPKPFNQIPDAI